ncbi:formyltetrahydrofolate-dependent phosphoribosylglycinamide formyltransferase [Ectothiorhodosinus mongolicus]|uniref:Phosphoribosylglycinamide formyltransferase n=1 Tax=Ectothiorhodosinus mongolicus TaxID=233100 RepID=A0A1R3VP25_9GAMM|nr:phosphoribosylglycinamide formyltransferase [Ectothiorhodosinus mongolicus]ULX56586.1 phosphoribosylglycinamide formyltransferase [Ectothiorhodosinus mongolicus]SIT66413.1 formyltetrahydrofolate-dependent phosphoribosylglycinamide formyltransferase [Ectothiorhodosinus mongolicus]
MSQKTGIVVLISGSGSNLQAIIDAVQSRAIEADIRAVISNRPGVQGLQRAAQAGITHCVIDHKDFTERAAFDQALMQEIDSHQPALVVLAGFMRVLTPAFVRHYEGRLLNVHPSLLPDYRGLHTHARALEDGADWHGCSIHFVTAELDGGPVIIQARVNIKANDTEESLAARVQIQEHIVYPLVIQWFCQGRLSVHEGKIKIDDQVLETPMLLENLRPSHRDTGDIA